MRVHAFAIVGVLLGCALDAQQWRQRATSTGPIARYDHGMAYDSARSRVVMFGGYFALAETWEWDSVTWTLRSPATSPPGRHAAAFAYDARRGRTVLFGGDASGRVKKVLQLQVVFFQPLRQSLF